MIRDMMAATSSRTISTASPTSAPELTTGLRASVARQALRDDAHLVIVDDSEEWCRALSEFVRPFVGRVTCFTDPREARTFLVGSSFEGCRPLLVVDMDMPHLTGRELLYDIAKSKFTIPFIVVSGGQGRREAHEFLKDLSRAETILALREQIESSRQAGKLPPFLLLGKERVASDASCILDAIDAAMLQPPANVSLLQETVGEAALHAKENYRAAGERESIAREISDALAAAALSHNNAMTRLCAQVDLPSIEPEIAGCISRLGADLFPNEVQDYDTVFAATFHPGITWQAFAHRVLGSAGFARKIITASRLESASAEPVVSRWARTYTADLRKHIAVFHDLETRLLALHARDTAPWVNVEDLCNEIVLGLPTGQRDRVLCLGFLQLPLRRDALKEAIRLSVDNALRAVEGNELGRVQVYFTTYCTGGMALEPHIEITDNGGGFPNGVLEAWAKGSKILRTDGSVSQGLMLLKRLVEQDLGGRVEIGNRDGGGLVTLVLPHPLES